MSLSIDDESLVALAPLVAEFRQLCIAKADPDSAAAEKELHAMRTALRIVIHDVVNRHVSEAAWNTILGLYSQRAPKAA